MTPLDLRPLPPADAIRFFESKGFQIGFSWQDIFQEEHARAFTVAKMMRLDLLQTVRQRLDSALRDGTTRAQFIKDLAPILRREGWWGQADLPDPLTGEVKRVQLGSPRRLALIYDVNLRSARAAGRWARIERLKDRLPFLRYSAVLDSRTRPKHRAWHGTVLGFDHVWWNTHYPPNGWRCRCTVQQFSEADLKRQGFRVTEAPRGISRPFENRRTGQVVAAPDGIDPGFAFNIGQAHMRGLTPPPISGPIGTPRIIDGATRPPWPGDVPAPAGRIFTSRGSDGADIEAFLEEFGAAPGKPVVFTDRIGEPVVISDDFFRRADGTLKVGKRDRRRALLLIADTLKDPAEIWWRWELIEKTGEYRLRRTYLSTYVVGETLERVVVGLDVGKDGWRGATAFNADGINQILNRRGGVLAYRRNKESPA
ncbi:MAG: PBECR2 nuclease fold domain-containing protein [Paracoccaceae bacterium]